MATGRGCGKAFMIVVGAIFMSCTSVHPKVINPTPDNPFNACYLTCKSGVWLSKANFKCSGSLWMEEIKLTGGEDVFGDPSQSRWFTGNDPIWVSNTIKETLESKGILPISAAWAKAYQEERAAIHKEYPDATLATYLKSEVALMSCERLVESRKAATAAEQRGQHPGEDIMGRSTSPPQ